MKKRYHFIGIGGIGMGALAKLLLAKGCAVSGSDVRGNKITTTLKEKGATIHLGHAAANVGEAEVVIVSSAIRGDNPEIVEARTRGIPIQRRAQLLAELMTGHVGITVAGAHGKTTTTSMVANLLTDAGKQPTTAVGGIVNATASNATLGEGTYFVAEVDESDGSFLYFFPKYSIITNIDFEHVDYFQNWKNILKAYSQFIRQTQKDGRLIACGDDLRLMTLLRECPAPVWTYGFEAGNDITAQNLSWTRMPVGFDCVVKGEGKGRIRLNVPGRHNVLNALACIGMGMALGIDFKTIQKTLESYGGVQRRFQSKGEVNGIWVVDDYAHHPTEIRSTLTAALPFKRKRVIGVFQPHRYTRVHHLMDELAKCFDNCDYLIITDIYAASEEPIAGVSGEALRDKVHAHSEKPVMYVRKKDIVPAVLDIARPGDLVLMMGAGDITYIADTLVDALEAAHQKEEKALEP